MLRTDVLRFSVFETTECMPRMAALVLYSVYNIDHYVLLTGGKFLVVGKRTLLWFPLVSRREKVLNKGGGEKLPNCTGKELHLFLRMSLISGICATADIVRGTER